MTVNLAIIPARGGSKGLPGKNILPICGKPLIGWSIEHALECQFVDEVFVSTDCTEIARVARSYGAKVPFLRPAQLASDEASTEAAVLHFLDWCDSESVSVDNLLLLQATSPVRNKSTLGLACEAYFESESDSLLSVRSSHAFFWQGKEKQPTSLNYDYLHRPRRQDVKISDLWYRETGSFYLFDAIGFRRTENRLFGKIYLFETAEEESFEIDTALDFRICEAIMKFQKDLSE